jgi:glucokinase
MFCAMLGTVAANLALTLGAQGGIYIAGGVVPRLGARFAHSDFRARFETKGRLSPYLAAMPTYVVTHELPAFLGCAAMLTDAPAYAARPNR